MLLGPPTDVSVPGHAAASADIGDRRLRPSASLPRWFLDWPFRFGSCPNSYGGLADRCGSGADDRRHRRAKRGKWSSLQAGHGHKRPLAVAWRTSPDERRVAIWQSDGGLRFVGQAGFVFARCVRRLRFQWTFPADDACRSNNPSLSLQARRARLRVDTGIAAGAASFFQPIYMQ
jgi:hypothetical protein